MVKRSARTAFGADSNKHITNVDEDCEDSQVDNAMTATENDILIIEFGGSRKGRGIIESLRAARSTITSTITHMLENPNPDRHADSHDPASNDAADASSLETQRPHP